MNCVRSGPITDCLRSVTTARILHVDLVSNQFELTCNATSSHFSYCLEILRMARCCADLSLLLPWTLSLHDVHIPSHFLNQTRTALDLTHPPYPRILLTRHCTVAIHTIQRTCRPACRTRDLFHKCMSHSGPDRWLTRTFLRCRGLAQALLLERFHWNVDTCANVFDHLCLLTFAANGNPVLCSVSLL